MLGGLYTGATLTLCSYTQNQEYKNHETFYLIFKYLDLLIGKFLLLLFGWNIYVMLTGYTHIEFKNLLETQIHNKNNELSPENLKKPTMVLYNYGFKTMKENFVRVFGTDK